MQISDIPSNGIVWDKPYGYVTIAILNELYTACLEYIKGTPVDVRELSTEIPYKDMHDALKGFKIFNIVNDVDDIVCSNLQKGIRQPITVHTDMTPYIKAVANKHLKFRPYQMNCDFILTALDSELYLFKNSIDLAIDVPYTSCTTLRVTAKPNKRNFIFNEATALSRLKDLLCDVYTRFKKFVYELQRLSLKFRSQLRVEGNADFDFEL